MRKTQVRSSSPMWYTAASEYAKKMQRRSNKTENSSLAWNENFVGLGHRLCVVGGTNRSRASGWCRPRSSTMRNEYLSTRAGNPTAASSTSPDVVHNVREPWYNRNNVVIKVKNAPSMVNRFETATQSDEDNESNAETYPPYNIEKNQQANKLVCKGSAILLQSNRMPLIMVRPDSKHRSPSVDPNIKKTPNERLRMFGSQRETAEDETANSEQDDARLAVAGATEPKANNTASKKVVEKKTKFDELNYKIPRVLQCYHGEYPATNSSLFNDENTVAACEVTEQHFISIDCNEGNQMEMQANRDRRWSAAPQFSLPDYQQVQDRKCAINSCTCCHPRHSLNNHKCVWKRPTFRSQQQLGNSPNQSSSFIMCCHHQQTSSNGPTELLAQQLQNQMNRAQVQISHVQMQLNKVCGASKTQQIKGYAHAEFCKQSRRDCDRESLPLDNKDATIVPPLQSPSNSDAQYLMAPAPVMGLGFYAIQQVATEEREAHYQYCDAARTTVQRQQCLYTPAQYSMDHEQQQPYQQQQVCQQEWQQKQQQPCQQQQPNLQQQPYQQQQQSFQQQQQQQYQQQQPYQQQQQQQYQQQATCPSIHCHWPCCRQHFARMRFVMPRCCQAGQQRCPKRSS